MLDVHSWTLPARSSTPSGPRHGRFFGGPGFGPPPGFAPPDGGDDDGGSGGDAPQWDTAA